MQLIGEKRDGDISISSGTNGQVVIEETFNYIVKTNDITADRLSVAQFSALPVVGLTRSSSGVAICKTKTCSRRQDNPYLWDVVCTFSSDAQQDDSSDVQNPTTSDPTSWVPIRETMYERITVPYQYEDVNGTKLVNTADQPFSNPLIVGKHIPIWEFTQFESPDVTDEEMLDRHETVNGSQWKNFEAYTMLCLVVSSVIGLYYGRRIRQTRYRLKYKKFNFGWRHTVNNIGTQYKDANGDLKTYMDDTENYPITGFLDANGNKTKTVTYKLFDVYETSDFSFLRI